MSNQRISVHPILKTKNKKIIEFYWNGRKLFGINNEPISSALISNNIHIFGHHHKDKSPQSIFCANGQCSQCMVIANEIPVKACMTKIKENMVIRSLEGLANLNKHNYYKDNNINKKKNHIRHVIPVLIIGGGPSGLSAAIELGKYNIRTIIIDDKDKLGGKLLLQTHKFFGSVEDSYAGTRGYEISDKLVKKIKKLHSIEIWTNSVAIGVFSDKVVGIYKDNVYKEIQPDKLLIATGARENMLPFIGNTLPGVYGAGAFQTLVNRDLIKSSNEIFIVGGGNVGLISAYHAIQANIKVIGLIEAMPKVGGYKVHADKLIRLGVPIYTQHTIVSANGLDHVNSITIARLDKNFKIKSNSYKTFKTDSILIAVGLTKADEFYMKAKLWGMEVYSAGDAKEIAEASSAMFTGKIEGLKIAKKFIKIKKYISNKWNKKVKILKKKPGVVIINDQNFIEKDISPVIHCYQEIPCNPCSNVCPENIIKTKNNKITSIPYLKYNHICKSCMACIKICPGLAITLIEYIKDHKYPTISIPYEMDEYKINKKNKFYISDKNGQIIGKYKIKKIIKDKKKQSKTHLIKIQAKNKIAKKIVGIRLQDKKVYPILENRIEKKNNNKTIICRCERITLEKIRNIIRSGITDLNQIKAITRMGMGACGSKTCQPITKNLFKKEGYKLNHLTEETKRPLFTETPINSLAGL